MSDLVPLIKTNLIISAGWLNEKKLGFTAVDEVVSVNEVKLGFKAVDEVDVVDRLSCQATVFCLSTSCFPYFCL
jgi:hypothetical protein